MISEFLLLCLSLSSISTLQAWNYMENLQQEMVKKLLQKEALLERTPQLYNKNVFFDLKMIAKADPQKKAALENQIKHEIRETLGSATEHEMLSYLLENETALLAFKTNFVQGCETTQHAVHFRAFLSGLLLASSAFLAKEKYPIFAIVGLYALRSIFDNLLIAQDIANIADGSKESIKNSAELIERIKTKLTYLQAQENAQKDAADEFVPVEPY